MTSDSPTLLQRIASGDAGAIEEFVDRYGGWVLSLAKGYVHDIELAEDATQEVFIEVWKNADRYDPAIASEATFVAMLARRRLIDAHRRSERRPRIEAVEPESVGQSDDGGIDGVDLRDEVARANDALSRLKPEQRELLKMWVVDGMTHGEIAELTGHPLGTVKSHLRRGLVRVRDILGTAGEGVSS
ncbi:MAG: sigma-70 family RNA polymerase sigma factor [Planctomycetota bacterium]